MIAGDAPWRAGRSALKWSRETRWSVSRIRIMLPWLVIALMVSGVSFYFKFTNQWIYIGCGIGLVLIFVIQEARWKEQRQLAASAARRQAKGGKEEKRNAHFFTRKLLLTRELFHWFHDRPLPKGNAQFDHAVCDCVGVTNVDSKHLEKKFWWSGEVLMYGDQPLWRLLAPPEHVKTKFLTSAEYESSVIQEKLDAAHGKGRINVFTIVAIRNASFDKAIKGRPQYQIGNALIMSTDSVPAYLKQRARYARKNLKSLHRSDVGLAISTIEQKFSRKAA